MKYVIDAGTKQAKKEWMAALDPTTTHVEVGSTYKCLKATAVHAKFSCMLKGKPMESSSRLRPGTKIDVLEGRLSESGVLRVRFSGGWVNDQAGAWCLVSKPQTKPQPETAAPEPEPVVAPAAEVELEA